MAEENDPARTCVYRAIPARFRLPAMRPCHEVPAMLTRILFLLALLLPSIAMARDDGEVYFSARADLRKCVFPLCGGFFVQRANRLATECADGRARNECYVAEADLSALGLSEEQASGARSLLAAGRALAKGSLRLKPYGDFGNLGVLVASEVWEAATETPPKGAFYRLASNGVVCIAYPCRSLREETLNAAFRRDIADPDFSAVGASESQLSAAQARLSQAGGILAAGLRRTVKGPGGKAPSLLLSQFYLPVQAGAPARCQVGGCSGELCTDSPNAISPCVYLPEYACYRTAVCERQTDSACGWTRSEELKACLEKARAQGNGSSGGEDAPR
jgi:hypothetical protein